MANVNIDNLEKEIKELVAEIVEVDPGEVTAKANFVDDLGMDSMQALEIMAAIEKKYSVQISEDYLGKITDLSSLLEVAEKIIGTK